MTRSYWQCSLLMVINLQLTCTIVLKYPHLKHPQLYPKVQDIVQYNYPNYYTFSPRKIFKLPKVAKLMSSKLIRNIHVEHSFGLWVQFSSSEYTMLTFQYIFWSALFFKILTTVKTLNINSLGTREFHYLWRFRIPCIFMLGPEQITNLSRVLLYRKCYFQSNLY